MNGPMNAQIEEFVRDVVARATVDEPRDLSGLLPLVYEDLRALAGYLLRGERDAYTLRPTALAHEAFLRLASQDRFRPENGAHIGTTGAKEMHSSALHQPDPFNSFCDPAMIRLMKEQLSATA